LSGLGNPAKPKKPEAVASLPLEVTHAGRERIARFARAALIALTLFTVPLFFIHPMNSYDVWTHLASGRLMWEEGRIPNHEPFSYTQNREMTVEEATPLYTVNQTLWADGGTRVIMPAGTPFDNVCRQRLRNFKVPESAVSLRVEPPLKRLTRDAVDAKGGVVLTTGTALGQAEIEKLKAAGVKTVEVTVRWVNHEWLFQIGAYLFYKGFGIYGPIFYKSLILMGAFLFVLFTVYDRRTHVIGLLGVLLVGVVSCKRFYMRPEVCSILFTAAWFFFIERFRRRQEGWSVVIWLPLLMVLWINTHGYFILGVAVMLLYIIGEGIQAYVPMPRVLTKTLRWKDDLIRGKGLAKLALATLLTIGATFINPYGINGARYPIDVLAEVADPTSTIRTVIGEMQSPFYFGFTYAVMFGWFLLYLGAASWVLNLRRLKLSRIIIWGVAIFFYTKALRNMPFLAIPGAVYLSLNCTEAWDDMTKFLRERVIPEVLTGARIVAQLALVGLLIFFVFDIATDRFYIHDVASQRFGVGPGYTPEKFSMGAIDFIRKNMNEDKLQGPMFNAFGMGGLCMWRLYPTEEKGPDGKTVLKYSGRRLFIDGRAEMYGGPFVRNYTRALAEPKVWEELDAKWQFGSVFLNWQASDCQRLMAQLYRDQDHWALCYGDGVGYVYVRNTPANRRLIEQSRNAMANPIMADFSDTWAMLASGMPGIPSYVQFVEWQDHVRVVAMILNGDPLFGARALDATNSRTQVRFDRRFMANGYDRLCEKLPFLPQRVIKPDDIQGTAGYALVNGQPDLAEAIYAGLQALSPDVAEIDVYIGNIYQARGENLLRSLNDQPDEAERKKMIDAAKSYLDRAIEAYQTAERLFPGYPGLTMTLLAISDEAQNRELVQKYLNQALANEYPSVNSCLTLGEICMKYGQPLQALKLYEATVDMLAERDRGPCYTRIGECYFKTGNPGMALKYLQLGADLDGGPMPWYWMAQVYWKQQGRIDEAIRCLKKALEIEPKFKQAADELHQLEELLRQRQQPQPSFQFNR
jgi:tetratricopeptide (TPR) repeat protein